MRELRRGLWHWQAPHPLGVPPEIERLAADRDTAIVLTAPWHERALV